MNANDVRNKESAPPSSLDERLRAGNSKPHQRTIYRDLIIVLIVCVAIFLLTSRIETLTLLANLGLGEVFIGLFVLSFGFVWFLYRRMQELRGDIAQWQNIQQSLIKDAQENSHFAIAINNLTSGVMITDLHQDDNPLIFVNQGFTTTTGYTSEEVIGKNCRFLQGRDTNPLDVERIRKADVVSFVGLDDLRSVIGLDKEAE